jgi:hypothetical protein
MNKLDRIIQMIREQMVANAPGASGGFSASADPMGPVAGYDTKMTKKGRKYMKGPGRKVWSDYLKSSNGRRT